MENNANPLNDSDLAECYHQFLADTGLKTGEARVTAGSAMVMMELRDTTDDIDVEVTIENYQGLVAEHELEEHTIPEGISTSYAVWDDRIHIHPVDSLEEGQNLGDVWCATAADVLNLKQVLDRDKDQGDIQLLKTIVDQEQIDQMTDTQERPPSDDDADDDEGYAS